MWKEWMEAWLPSFKFDWLGTGISAHDCTCSRANNAKACAI